MHSPAPPGGPDFSGTGMDWAAWCAVAQGSFGGFGDAGKVLSRLLPEFDRDGWTVPSKPSIWRCEPAFTGVVRGAVTAAQTWSARTFRRCVSCVTYPPQNG